MFDVVVDGLASGLRTALEEGDSIVRLRAVADVALTVAREIQTLPRVKAGQVTGTEKHRVWLDGLSKILQLAGIDPNSDDFQSYLTAAEGALELACSLKLLSKRKWFCV